MKLLILALIAVGSAFAQGGAINGVPENVQPCAASATSGGIAFFNSTTTCASSAAGSAGTAILWGGAGNAPLTPGVIVVTNSGLSNETWTFKNPVASTGSTSVVIQAGAGDTSSTKNFQLLSNGGTVTGYWNATNGQLIYTGALNYQPTLAGTSFAVSGISSSVQASMNALGQFGWTQDGANITHGPDTGLSRDSAGVIDFGTGAQGSKAGSWNATNGTLTGTASAKLYATATVCASGASPAVCSSASAGAVAIPTGVNSTLVVNTTAVTANSTITIIPDDSLTIGGTTCNSTLAQLVGGIAITARTAATSFTISYNGTITVNPICVSYTIEN